MGLTGFSRINCTDADLRHCTVFTISQDDRVLFAGNDDYINADSVTWTEPSGSTGYGALYFGEPDNVQQGFNERGLAYDSNGLPEAPVTSHPGRTPVYGGYGNYPIQILRTCATVEEVIAWVRSHRWHDVMHDQLHFADATGDAVVISAGPDGKVSFTRKPAGDGFLISTNFNVANPTNGGYPCWRYDRAEAMLSEIGEETPLTVESVAAVAEAVHVEGPSGWTLYSLVADLRARKIYVYFMFQYDAPIVLDLEEEIARRQPTRPVSARFPEATQRRADQAYRRLMARSDRCETVGFVWPAAVMVSLVGFLILRRLESRTSPLWFWVPVVAVLGPFGLGVWLYFGRRARGGPIVDAAGDLPAYVIGLVGAALILVLVPGASTDVRLQLLVLYGIPLVVGLLLYASPLLAWATGTGYPRTLLRRLPAGLVVTNLALSGLLAFGLPLLNAHVNLCGFSLLSLLPWWAIAAVSALAAGLLLAPYHAWTARRGLATWSVWLVDVHENGSRSPLPSWRHLRFWIPASFALLFAGAALGVVISFLIIGVV